MNSINNRLAFKIKDGCKLELQTPETMKLLCSTKKLIDKTKNGENSVSLEVVEVVLIQCNLQRIYIDTSLRYYILLCPINKSYAYLLNVKPSNLVS